MCERECFFCFRFVCVCERERACARRSMAYKDNPPGVLPCVSVITKDELRLTADASGSREGGGGAAARRGGRGGSGQLI